MNASEPIGLANTWVPMLLLGAAAFLLPRVLHRNASTSHLETAVVIWASAGLLLILSALVFAGVYAYNGAEVAAAFDEAQWQTTGFFLGRGLVSALIWGPVLGLVWLDFAQQVEAERARDLRSDNE